MLRSSSTSPRRQFAATFFHTNLSSTTRQVSYYTTSHFSYIAAAVASLCLSAFVLTTFEDDVRRGCHSAIQRTELEEDQPPATTTVVLNWSGTHAVEVPNDRYWEPDSVEQVEKIVQECHAKGQSVRPFGSALSPNGVAFSSHGMMSLAHLDRILAVDHGSMTVTVQAGARVSQVIDALRPHQLTLPNLASIAEQQMGGFVQVGAHGTGRCISPVDHYVTALKLVTPGKGTVTLTPEDGDVFHLAKVGLGCLGIVVEITIQCIPAHRLVEHTFVLTRQQAKEQLDTLLKDHKHMRYMWIPYTDSVVVVTNDPEDASNTKLAAQSTNTMDDEERLRPLTNLLLELSKEHHPDATHPKDAVKGMGFGELRDALLAFDPLNNDHVRRCNQAEAEFWRRSEGYQVKPSDQLLQFDCGGQVRIIRVGCVSKPFVSGCRSHLSSMLLYSNGFGSFASQLAHKTKATETI